MRYNLTVKDVTAADVEALLTEHLGEPPELPFLPFAVPGASVVSFRDGYVVEAVS